jgi:hypothetical protein
MLFNLRSIVLFSASTATSPLCCGPVAAVPPGVAPAEPVVVVDPVVADDPEELAVPALLVPGGGGEATLAAFPAPLGSLPELFRPPTLAGPDGTPLTAAVPAPAEPAPGEPVAVPADGPLAAPPALCANEPAGDIKMAIAASAAAVNVLVIAKLPLEFNDDGGRGFPGPVSSQGLLRHRNAYAAAPATLVCSVRSSIRLTRSRDSRSGPSI